MTIGLFIVLLQKPRLNVTENAHLTTRMRTGGDVYSFHGLLILLQNYQPHKSFEQSHADRLKTQVEEMIAEEQDRSSLTQKSL